MIIGYISTTLGLGGTENWVELAAGALSRKGHDVVVIAERAPFDRAERIIKTGAKVFCFDSPQPIDKYARIFQSVHVQLIHLHVWERVSDLMDLRPLTGVPLLRSYHATLNHRLPGWIWWGLMLARQRGKFLNEWHLSKRWLDAHIGCCQTAAESIVRIFGKRQQNRIFGLDNGITLPPKIPDHVFCGPTRFLQVGSLTKRKRPDLTLRAFANISKKKNDLSLVFVGDGPLMTSLRQFAASCPWMNVTFAGPQTNVAPFYAQANVLVLPSRAEGLPYALLEAGGHGLALIATDRGGMAEVVQQGRSGLLVALDSENALCKAMRSLAKDPEQRMSLGCGARSLIEQHYLLDDHIDHLLQIYERVLGNAH